MTVSGFSTLCFGKLPSQPDFVRFNAASREILAFDEWVRTGLYTARTRIGQGWEQAFTSSPRYRFIFYPENADRFLSGVIQASQDKSQRRYPFLVSMLLDRRCVPDNLVHLLPLAFSRFFGEAGTLLSRALEGLELRAIAESVQSLDGPVSDHGETEFRYQSEYLDSCSVRKFWEDLFGTFDDPRKYLVLRNLAEILLPVRHRSVSRLNLGLRFPLFGGQDAVELKVCFWLQLALLLIGSSPGRPSLFWNLPENGAPAYLFLFFRQPSPAHFVQLMKPEAEGDSVCAVEEDGREKLVSAAQTLPPGYRASLESGGDSMRQFLVSVTNATR